MSTLLVVWAVGYAITVGGIAFKVRKFWRRCEPRPDLTQVPAIVVRPCAGAEPHLAYTLESITASRSTFPLSVVMTVARADDPALPIAERAARALVRAGIPAEAVVVVAEGPNQKAAQLAAISRQRSPQVLISADSDVDLSGVDLDALIAPLVSGEAAATWAPPVEDEGLTPGDRASRALLDSSLHAFGVLAAIDPGGFVGKLHALRSDAVQRAGGLAALSDYLGEDLELGRRLRASGQRIRAVPLRARSRVSGRSVAAVIERYGRWLAVIRAQRPALLVTYPLLFFPLPLIAVAAAIDPGQGLAALLIVLLSRWILGLTARRASGRDSRGLAAAVISADLLLAAAFVRALGSRRVRWRGRVLRLHRGRLRPEGGAR